MKDMIALGELQWNPSCVGVQFGGTVEEGRQWLRDWEATYGPSDVLLRIEMPCGHTVEYAHVEDVPVVDVPCSCGDPRHSFIKWVPKWEPRA